MAVHSPASPERLTREQTSRTALEQESEFDPNWQPLPFTAAPPPRPGMEQRWVRCRLGTENDVANTLKRQQQGWKPRAGDTVPPQFSMMRRDFDKFSSVIQNQDCVLMERPVEYGRKMREIISTQTRRLQESIRDYIGQMMPRQHGTRGGAVDEIEVRSTVGSGRIPTIPD